MIYYDDTDLALTLDGDFIIDETGDLKIVSEFECTADDINMAVKTQKNDSEVFPQFGADLEELIGQPNTREVGDDGRNKIIEELVNNKIVNSDDLEVVPIPIDDSITYYIVVEQGAEKKIVEHTLNLNDSVGGGQS
jgi:hypothetical protein